MKWGAGVSEPKGHLCSHVQSMALPGPEGQDTETSFRAGVRMAALRARGSDPAHHGAPSQPLPGTVIHASADRLDSCLRVHSREPNTVLTAPREASYHPHTLPTDEEAEAQRGLRNLPKATHFLRG